MKRLYIHSPTVIASGQIGVSFDPDSDYPVAELPITSITGDTSDIKAGLTVIFGSAPGADDLGRQRIRRDHGPSASILMVGYSSRGNHDGAINVDAGSYFTVLDDRRVWARQQRFYTQAVEPFVTILKDWDQTFVANGEGTLFYPKANAGPARAGTIDPATGKLRVAFDGSASTGMPLGVNITGFLWDFVDGTVITGDEDEAEATVDFPPGFRYVSLTVTDENGMQHPMYVPVYARDPENDTCVAKWQILGSLTRTQEGQTLRVRVMSELPRATYPDGATVLYFDDENPDHTCEFFGWHHSDEASLEFVKTGYLRDTVLTCVDMVGKLDTLPGQTQVIEHADEPANWTQMYHPTMYMLIDYILRWHSTALELADFSLPDLDAGYGFGFIVREAGADTIYRQIAEQARSICPDHTIGCNRRGQLVMRIDPQLQPTSARTNIVQATLNGHIGRVSLVHERPPRYQWIRGGAVLEGWTPIATTQQVAYIIRPAAFADVGATTISTYELPVAVPSGAKLYLIGLGGQLLERATTTAAASAGDTSLSVGALVEPVDEWDELQYTATEAGPSNVPTAFCIAPGRVYSQGAQTMTVGNKLAQNGAGLSNMIGQLWARANAEFRQIDVELADGELDIDPTEMTWVDSTGLDARYLPQRALPFFANGTRLLPLEFTRNFNVQETGIVETCRVRLERETSGPSATRIEGDEV